MDLPSSSQRVNFQTTFLVELAQVLNVSQSRFVFISILPGSVVVKFLITASAQLPAGTLVQELKQLVASNEVRLVGAKVLNVVAVSPTVVQTTTNNSVTGETQNLAGWMEEMIFEGGGFSLLRKKCPRSLAVSCAILAPCCRVLICVTLW